VSDDRVIASKEGLQVVIRFTLKGLDLASNTKILDHQLPSSDTGIMIGSATTATTGIFS
jgi:hypothetical protein